MLAGVTRKMAGQFFTALDQHIAGVLPAGTARTDGGRHGVGRCRGRRGGRCTPADAGLRTAAGTVSMDSGARFAAGVLVGGILALAGVALGARIGRRP